jgi:hypothetical protein
MGEIVNLNQFRKARAKAESGRKAAENRVRHGQTKEERLRQSRERELRQRELEGKRVDPAGEPDDGDSTTS